MLEEAHSKLEPSDLRGVNWRLIGILDGAGTFSQVLGDVVITAFFDQEDRVSGSSGCNRYTGPAIRDGVGISVGVVAGTRMMCCDSQVMAQESRYLGLLAQVAAYRLSVGAEGGLPSFSMVR
ncbi:MAG: META domain-containing protein [Acidimicrobiia bacterium]